MKRCTVLLLAAALCVAASASGCGNKEGAKLQCMNNLKMIGAACIKYQRQAGQTPNPHSLQELVDAKLLQAGEISCPAGGAYLYVPKTRGHADSLVACDPGQVHGGGRCCLFGDGSVRFVPAASFTDLLAMPMNQDMAAFVKGE